MKSLFSLALIALTFVAPALAQPGMRPGVGGESMADLLTRRARVLDDSLGLDDAQETRLRGLFADRLDSLAAQAARTAGPRPRPMPGTERRSSDARPQWRREGERPYRPGALDVRYEPVFATLDADVRALLTSDQEARYNAFRQRERARFEAFRAARERSRSGTR